MRGEILCKIQPSEFQTEPREPSYGQKQFWGIPGCQVDKNDGVLLQNELCGPKVLESLSKINFGAILGRANVPKILFFILVWSNFGTRQRRYRRRPRRVRIADYEFSQA